MTLFLLQYPWRDHVNWSHMCSNTWFCPTKQFITHVFKQELVFFYYTLNLLSFTAIVFNLPFLRVHEQANICKTTLKKNDLISSPISMKRSCQLVTNVFKQLVCPTKQFITNVFKQELFFFYYTLNLLSFTAIVFNLPFLRVHEQANICKTTLKKTDLISSPISMKRSCFPPSISYSHAHSCSLSSLRFC
jgi:hypothetical protein